MTIPRTIAVGTLFVVAVFVGLDYMEHAGDSVIAAADAAADTATAHLIASARRSRASLAKQKALSDAAEKESIRAESASRQLRYLLASTTVKADTPSTGDTTAMILVSHSSRPGQHWRMPQFLFEEHQALQRTAIQFEAAWQRERGARLNADSVTIPDLKRQLYDADDVIAKLRISVDVRDKVRHPRCGAKCGAAIAITALVVTAFTVGKLRSAVK